MEITTSYSVTTIKPYQIPPSAHCPPSWADIWSLYTRWTPNACVELCNSINKSMSASLSFPVYMLVRHLRHSGPSPHPLAHRTSYSQSTFTLDFLVWAWPIGVTSFIFLCTRQSSEHLLPCMLFMVVLLLLYIKLAECIFYVHELGVFVIYLVSRFICDD